MLKTTNIILNELKQYSSPADKLSRLVKEGEYLPVVKGLYETDGTTPGYLLAESIYGPSYLSFEFALSYHGLIPEAVYTFTCATCEKKKKKEYITSFGNYTYRDIPMRAYCFGVEIQTDDKYSYKIATAEKALCDQLYKEPPVANNKELRELLFEDLRIDEQRFAELKVENITFLAERYGNRNVKRLAAYMRRLNK